MAEQTKILVSRRELEHIHYLADRIYYYGDDPNEASDNSNEIRKLTSAMLLEQPESGPGNAERPHKVLDGADVSVEA